METMKDMYSNFWGADVRMETGNSNKILKRAKHEISWELFSLELYEGLVTGEK